jgi:hypothetical protein
MSEHEHDWYEMRVFRFCRECGYLERRREGVWKDANQDWFDHLQLSKRPVIIAVEKQPSVKTDQPQQLQLF